MSANKALLLINIQKGSFTSDTPRHDSYSVVKWINESAD